MRTLYTVLSILSLPAIVVRLWWRGRRLPGYRRRMMERFGAAKLQRTDQPLVWVHAVSVGETIAALPVVNFLLSRGDVQVLVTTMTPTGSERVTDLFGERVLHCYMPYDIPFLIRRFLQSARPSLFLIMETELWPNTVRACHKRQIPVVLLNARLSEKSARGYGLMPGLTQEILEELSLVAVQAQEDAQRFLELGLPSPNCTVTGSIKFDLTLDNQLIAEAAAVKREWAGEDRRPIWIAASTHAGEEELVLEAFERIKQTQPRTLLILVPRHPDRFEAVAKLCDASGQHWRRRSNGEAPDAETDILLGDTMGEMLLLYGVADLAFVGGSLVPTGGHNLIEPAAWGLPLLSGPNVFNFAEVARLMLKNGALTVVKDAQTLTQAVCHLLSDVNLRNSQGAAARRVADANRGALAKVEGLLERYLGGLQAASCKLQVKTKP